MRRVYALNNSWKVCKASQEQASADAQQLSLDGGNALQDTCWYTSDLPTSVQDILCRNGVIPSEARNGTQDLQWVAQSGWIYLRHFSVEEDPAQICAVLNFSGMDTVAELFLNGVKIGTHESMYLRKQIDVTRVLQKENCLAILFRSPVKEIERLAQQMPEAWEGVIEKPRLLRKALADSGTFLGNVYPCTCVGLYDEVTLEVTEKAGHIAAFETDYDLSWNLKKARLQLTAVIEKEKSEELSMRFQVIDPEGNLVVAENACQDLTCETLSGMQLTGISSSDAGYTAVMEISAPELWWPQPYGPQNLYHVRAELYQGEVCLDAVEKKIGFRYTEYEGDFRFRINHRRIRLWGSNFVNVDGLTHWCDRERITALMTYAKEGNFNMLRVWGEAPMLPDLFYDLADAYGILIWQDFGLGFGPWPDSAYYQKLFNEEVSQMVGRLKSHPAILLWCGSNETYMTGVSGPSRDGPQYGFNLIFRIGADVCRRLDPKRLYIPSTPMGGDYPQDAAGGDIHGYWGNHFEIAIDYPVLFSESCHATTYCRHSMLRFMTEEEIWPEGYADTHTYSADYFGKAAEKGMQRKDSYALAFQNSWRQITMPETWRSHMSGFAPSELWDLENYFDAHDADSILYKYAVCGADFYKREIERIRRGRPCRMPYEPRRCSGYLTWKYNDAWPHINFTQIDYYLEPTAQYYALKRGFAPVLAGVCAEQDHLYLWAVNDSPKDVRGEITLRIFSRLCNQIEQEYRFPVWIRPDESKTVDCLDWLGSLPREWILHTSFIGENGEDYGSNICYLDKERNLSFPKPKLQMGFTDGYLEIRTDVYARYIELTGESGSGDQFGWKFSDNYFDLLPFETKRVRIGGQFDAGRVSAEAFYGEESVSVEFGW